MRSKKPPSRGGAYKASVGSSKARSAKPSSNKPTPRDAPPAVTDDESVSGFEPPPDSDFEAASGIGFKRANKESAGARLEKRARISNSGVAQARASKQNDLSSLDLDNIDIIQVPTRELWTASSILSRKIVFGHHQMQFICTSFEYDTEHVPEMYDNTILRTPG
jgi:hypothetical protein